MRASWIFLILSCCSPIGHPFTTAVPTASISTSWNNNASHRDVILFRETNDTQFGCGFFCEDFYCTSYSFVIFIRKFTHVLDPDMVVWSANRDYPVGGSAVLNFTAAGELVLQDVDGSRVWTTNTAGKSVVGMNLTDTGNLVLFDVKNSVVWQSFDHPTDCLLPGQKLVQGQKLISGSNLSKGIYSLHVTDKGLFASIESNPPQAYFSYLFDGTNTSEEKSYVKFLNGSLSVIIQSAKPNDADYVIGIPQETSSPQYMKLMPDGHMKVFEWQSYGSPKGSWSEVADLLSNYLEACDYPSTCGRNAICSTNQQCHCPILNTSLNNYFRAVNDMNPDMGCSEIIPLTCNSTQYQDLIMVENVRYFTNTPDMEGVSMETCKQACLNNCSCKAAFFEHDYNASSGSCYLPSDLFRMKSIESSYASAFIKVQNVSPSGRSPSPKKGNRVEIVLSSSVASLVAVLIVSVGFIMFVVDKRTRNAEMAEDYLDQIPGMPIRFSYEELKTATENFTKKLGKGGFGTVFEGQLEDGSKIAVKCLEGLAHVKKSFLAEVESIGSLHHVNLVRLQGFCVWRSRRLLVYEFMSNGSLDRWIYHGDKGHVLEWECRKKIILDIAKGLAYLHEECRQKIIHLDIKPQNILLDNDFNAKVSDFGLSKLIDRNESQVMTTMRGTPSYMAPEWLSSVITEKVDVYSFGIVLLEILCGRKNFDRSQPEESWHLLAMFQICWEQGTLLHLVDKYSNDMQENCAEVVEMMKVASWCLQTDFTRRPSMSSVVKVLEGGMNVETNLDYNFTDPRMQKKAVGRKEVLTQLLPSFLSGPR